MFYSAHILSHIVIHMLKKYIKNKGTDTHEMISMAGSTDSKKLGQVGWRDPLNFSCSQWSMKHVKKEK